MVIYNTYELLETVPMRAQKTGTIIRVKTTTKHPVSTESTALDEGRWREQMHGIEPVLSCLSLYFQGLAQDLSIA